MLLLDHNLPHRLQELLAAHGLTSETAASRGWERLRNGELARDVKFAQSAAKSLQALPTMALVVITLPQRRWELYAESFRNAWNKAAIVPQAGQVVFWP